jgi:plasmid stabilization system protein ParE
MQVQFTPSAQKSLDKAIDYIASHNPFAVKSFVDRVGKAVSQIGLFPESGARIPEFPTTLYRQVFSRPYRLFYRVEDDIVWVAAVYHDKQLPFDFESDRDDYF